ncbi:hypothetical protein C0J52_23357 [Blattella germanica]|nr:hypothetical protein C0J52_23357 [Blattella germanica]
MVTPPLSVTTYENRNFDAEDPDIGPENLAGMRSLIRHPARHIPIALKNTTASLCTQILPTFGLIFTYIFPVFAAGVYTIATPVGCLLCGFLMAYIGRKLTMQLGYILFVPGWLLISFAQNHAMIFVGIVVAGLAKGLTAGAPMVLLDELADPKVRGVMCCMGFVFMSLGIFMVSFLGVILSWQLVAGIGCILAVICLLISCLVVESPVWLARNGRTKRAEKALNWIWGPNKEAEAKHDLNMIMKSIQSEEDERLQSNASSWRMFITARVMKPFLIIHAFNLFQIICGTNIMIFFSLTIMQQIESIPGMLEEDGADSKLATVLISIVRVIFMIVACVLLFLIGRRSLAITSGIGSSLAAIVLGIFLYVQSTTPLGFIGVSWIALALVLAFVATNTIGFFVLPSVMMGEVLPAKIRSIACGYIYAINDVGMCFAIKAFPSMSESLGSHGVFWMFGIASVACTLLVYLLMPETQGRSLEQIEEYFADSNIFWFNRRRHQSSPMVKRSSKIFS